MFKFNWPSLFLGLLAGLFLGSLLAYYLFKRYFAQKMQEMTKLMKKEEIRQLAGVFGHNLSEKQVNLMVTN